ncbi:MAG TPA: type II toxin-antitoxin system prevent-host-death family antitoxin [Pseudolabrys sp.]|jgi:prevent-host-death family protein|nr:type II toxin-antitoxin system prevent-host-death family antitoxin [Pseudolabrys sp.]
MTKHVGMFEAKTNLSALVEEVEKGGTVVITRHGKPVAKLVPAQRELTDEQIAERRKALKEIRARANELKINATPEEIKSWINEGRH